jgi:hypothetical protein
MKELPRLEYIVFIDFRYCNSYLLYSVSMTVAKIVVS